MDPSGAFDIKRTPNPYPDPAYQPRATTRPSPPLCQDPPTQQPPPAATEAHATVGQPSPDPPSINAASGRPKSSASRDRMRAASINRWSRSTGGQGTDMTAGSHYGSNTVMPAMGTSASPTAAGRAALKRLRQWPGEHRVAVGLSGGVDSSLTAALLVEAGWHVEGLTLWLMSGKGACCAEGLVDAAGICEQLGIDHHVVDTKRSRKLLSAW